ncbi:alpha/beta hydrolase [Marinomonas pollencensis]|uniref:Epoxide hydrolase n=1 Tax=Marinomonas pollencensis TaxID=491954 RepID=A0A3E0DRZ3_9GAMM|nr:alpha/beta hydrolase [Marinomonas pollencensis]REG85794.1 epoxide hydrolase [Marinomonas pollencensis]
MGQNVVFNLAHTKIAGIQWLSQNPSALKVLSLHGWLDNAASFRSLSFHLSDFNHSALDFAGHGFSDHRPDGCFYHLWDYVLDTVSVLNQSNQSSWLIGHSMGGAVAMMVAAVAPEKVRGLILLDNMGPLTGEPEERVSTLQKSIRKMSKYRAERFSRYVSKEEMVFARMNGFTSLSYDAASLLVERGARQDVDTWSWRHDGKLTLPSPFRMDEASVDAFISQIKCPVLALIAEQGVYEKADFLVEKRAEQFSWLTLKRVKGNHHFHLEPETAAAVAGEIQAFIDLN